MNKLYLAIKIIFVVLNISTGQASLGKSYKKVPVEVITHVRASNVVKESQI